MKVRTLINRLLNYNMDHDVELVILGEYEERYTCTLKDDCIDGHGDGDYCPIIFNTNEIKDDDESIQDLILYKHCLINSRKNKLREKKTEKR